VEFSAPRIGVDGAGVDSGVGAAVAVVWSEWLFFVVIYYRMCGIFVRRLVNSFRIVCI